MEKYRVSYPEERDAIIDFGNYIYSYDGIPLDAKNVSRKLFADVVPAEEFAKATYIALEDEKIVGMACCPVIDATICDVPVKMGQVGMVATHIYARGKGYMKELMRLMLADTEDVDLLMLGGLHQRYQVHGFEYAGTQIMVNYSKNSLQKSFGDTDTSAYRFQEIEAGSEVEHKAFELYKEKMPTILRNESTFYNIIRSFDRKPIAIFKEDTFIGYFITDCYATQYPKTNGTEEIPELFITDESLLGQVLFAWQQKTKSDNFKLCVFPTEPERLKLALPTCEMTTIEATEMIRVNNWLPVLRACCKLKEITGKLADSSHVLKVDGKSFRITVKGGKTDVQITEDAPELVLNGLDAIQTIFHPAVASVPALNPIPELLPLPFVLSFTDKF